MAVELSKNMLELFAGKKRARIAPTLVIATLVTALVGIPLWMRAWDSRDDISLTVADADQILVDTLDGDPGPLDQAVISGNVLISYVDGDAEAVSWQLFKAGEATPTLQSQDRIGPQFDLMLSDAGVVETLDSTWLGNGTFELFVAVATESGEERTAVSFEVANTP